MNKLKREILEGVRDNPIKLIWQLLWAIPIHTVAILLSVLVGLSALSWNEGVAFYWRLVN